MRSDDLVPILADVPDRGLQLQQGTVVSWNTTTGANSITVGVNTLTNLPIIGPITGIAAADEVMILSTSGMRYVLGKLTRP